MSTIIFRNKFYKCYNGIIRLRERDLMELYELRKNLRDSIKNSPFTVQEVADRAGYSKDYINRLKRGDKSPQLHEENITRLAKALDLSAYDILPDVWKYPTGLDSKILERCLEISLKKEKLNLENLNELSNSISTIYPVVAQSPEIEDYVLLIILNK